LEYLCVYPRELTSEKAVGAQILQEIGNTVEPTIAHRVIQGPREGGAELEYAAIRIRQIQSPDFCGAALVIHLEHRQRFSAAAQEPSGSIGGASRSPDR
jgi:hypothetical protein